MNWGATAAEDKCHTCMVGYIHSDVGRCIEANTRDVDKKCDKADPQGWCTLCKEGYIVNIQGGCDEQIISPL